MISFLQEGEVVFPQSKLLIFSLVKIVFHRLIYFPSSEYQKVEEQFSGKLFSFKQTDPPLRKVKKVRIHKNADS